MIIKRFKIDCFRGLKDTGWIEAKDLNIFEGANATGKTTKIDALMWVLCGETLVYGKQDNDNRNKNNLKDIVHVLVELANGVVLERKYYDVWKENEYVRTENQFYVSNAKYKKEEFYDYIRTSIGIENNTKVKDFNLLRFLFDYNYFSTIDYKVARKFLEERMHLKSDNELVMQPQYKPIMNDLIAQRFEIGKVKNQYKIEKDNSIVGVANLQEQLDQLNIVDEPKDVESIEKEILNHINSFVDDMPEYKELVKQKNELVDKEKELMKDLSKEKEQLQNEYNEIVNNGNKAKLRLTEISNQISSLERENDSKASLIKSYNARINDLENMTKEILCPNCNYVLNQADIESTNEKVAEIKKSIKVVETAIEDNKTKIEDLSKESETAHDDYVSLAKQYYIVKDKLDNAKEKCENFTNEEIEKQIDEINIKGREYVDNFNKERQDKITELTTYRNKVQSYSYLKNQIVELQKTIAKIDIKASLLNDYKNEKLNNIKQNVKSVFKNVEIDLIEYNQNTDVSKDVCYAKLKNVEYNGINDGYKYLLGIQIIEDVKASYGNLDPTPIIFDKFNDIDSRTLAKIRAVTKAQIFATKVVDNVAKGNVENGK